MSTEAEEAKPMLHLRSADKEDFEVQESAATQSQFIKNLLEDVLGRDTIFLPNVGSDVLAKILEYCNKHVEPGVDEAALKTWDTEFINNFNLRDLLKLILAVNYLDIKNLMQLVTQEIADRIKDMGVEEVRKIFNIQNDFTPEEEEELRSQHPWAYKCGDDVN